MAPILNFPNFPILLIINGAKVVRRCQLQISRILETITCIVIEFVADFAPHHLPPLIFHHQIHHSFRSLHILLWATLGAAH